MAGWAITRAKKRVRALVKRLAEELATKMDESLAAAEPLNFSLLFSL